MNKDTREPPARDITEDQEAAIVELAEAALSKADNATDAAEMLFGASTMVLLRQFGGANAVAISERFTAVQREVFERHNND